MTLSKRKGKSVLAIVLSIVMMLFMIPMMAFADNGYVVEQYDYTNPQSANTEITLYTGGSTTLQVTASVMDSSTLEYVDNHIDWSSTSSLITVGKHSGRVTVVGASSGTAIVTGTVRTGLKQSGYGDPSLICPGTVVGTFTVTINVVTNSTYGYQGEGGNTMLLTSPTSATLVSYTPATTSTSEDARYLNDITGLTLATETVGTTTYYKFGYTMSAGINNFKQSTFNTYAGAIQIFNAVQADGTGNYDTISGSAVVSSATFLSFSSPNIYIGFPVASLTSGNHYILRFGPSVCGNNSAKKLGCYIDFMFQAP